MTYFNHRISLSLHQRMILVVYSVNDDWKQKMLSYKKRTTNKKHVVTLAVWLSSQVLFCEFEC